ncbi:AraC family transcriptional regulator [Pokkaliibacter plantistimulans]|uniref:AraC family transcriptional regulator n=1 Tax=Proteobacteria bacterium 228 TaxID=2083153 RepID=A0A2S5KKE6_9PROT|nr:helix-turn-helix domain-containing protein [Pokkaliibacter plantistimulans]PPC75314.1 AraC family transcriptional regulator [Pokkaliibacter plantistimulans]
MTTSGAVRIAIVAYEHALPSALHGLSEMLAVAEKLRLEHGADSWLPLHCGFLCLGSNRLALSHHWSLQDEVDVVILPPCSMGERAQADEAFFVWLRQQYQRGALLCSACVGAALLAESGLFNGRRLTTHWLAETEFRQRYPQIHWDTAPLLIEEADVISAGGLTAWTDLVLRLLLRCSGPSLVMLLSKYFLLDTAEREQRFYQRFIPLLSHGDAQVLQLQRQLQQALTTRWSLEQLAAQIAVSPRTLQRRFLQATGHNLSRYIQLLRIEKARELLETSRMAVEKIVWAVGYDDRTSFNKLFRQQLGLSPSEYRRRFQTKPALLAKSEG